MRLDEHLSSIRDLERAVAELPPNYQKVTAPEEDFDMKDWPRVLLTTVTFEEDGAQTKLRLTWVPHEASEAEIACFAAAISVPIWVLVGYGLGYYFEDEISLVLKSMKELKTIVSLTIFATIFPASDMTPSTNVSCAPAASHS